MRIQSLDNQVLDKVKNVLSLRKESELANMIEISTSGLYKIRSGKTQPINYFYNKLKGIK